MKCKPYKNEFGNEKEAKNLFQILPFYNVLIEKSEIKNQVNSLHILMQIIYMVGQWFSIYHMADLSNG